MKGKIEHRSMLLSKAREIFYRIIKSDPQELKPIRAMIFSSAIYIYFLTVVRETISGSIIASDYGDERRANVKFINKTRRVIIELELGSFMEAKKVRF